MAAVCDIVERAVDAVLEDIQNYAPHEFQQLLADPEKKQALIQKAREAAAEEVKLADSESRVGQPGSATKSPSKHLPIELIRKRLLSLGRRWQTGQGRGSLEVATIIVWAVLLTLRAVGVKVAVTEVIIKKTVEEIVPAIQSSEELQQAVQKFKESVRGGSKWKIAEAIFNLIRECYSTGILQKVIKGLYSDMTWWDLTITIGVVSAMIVATQATGGTALIARILLILTSAQL